jgi:ribosomal protein L37E
MLDKTFQVETVFYDEKKYKLIRCPRCKGTASFNFGEYECVNCGYAEDLFSVMNRQEK